MARDKGEEELALDLARKAAQKLPELASKLRGLLEKYSIESRTERVILAEKLLDEYLRYKEDLVRLPPQSVRL